SSALAQSANPGAGQGQVEELVVTARRREERLLDVPIAITAVSGTQIQQQNIASAIDLQRIAPGLVAGPAGTRGSNQLVLSIRGQRNGDASIGSDASIGVYFAEVPYTTPQGLNLSLFDLNSVQVLKGPQGTLFGRNATGGAVLIEPNMP